MRTDLSQAFLDELAKSNRAPVTFAEFDFADGTRYLSDQPFGIMDGFAQEYEPIVANWGQMRDNVRIEPILGGTSLEVRQQTLTIINMGEDRFSQKFKDINPENVIVRIYQWFADLDPSEMVLIDVMVCQDPIVISEAQALLNISLVSPIMTQNPFIWGPDRFLEVRYPMVLGKWKTVAKSMETGPTAILIYDIDQNFTGEVFIEDSVGDWPTPPFNVFVDSEQLTVDFMAVSKMNITARGQQGTVARPHIRGALICDPSAQYDYSLTAGPVSLIEDLLADGETYNNPYTLFEGENPAFIRFDGRPPWHKVEAGEPGEPIIPDPTLTSQYGLNSETYMEVETTGISSPGNINNAGSNAVMAIDDTIGELPGELYVLYYGKDEIVDYGGAPSAYRQTISEENINNSFGSRGYMQWFRDNNVQGEIIAVGDTLEYISDFNQYVPDDDVDYQTFIKAYVEIEADFSARGCQGTGSVILKVGSSETVLWTLGSIGNADPSTYFSRLEVPVSSVEGIINSWTDLQGAQVILRFECTRTSAWSSDSGKRWEFAVGANGVKWHVFYTYDDPGTDPTYPVQEIVSHFNRDLSSLGAFISAEIDVTFDCSVINCTATQRIIGRTDGDPDGSTYFSRQITGTQAMQTFTIYPSISSMAHLKTFRIGVRHEVDGPVQPGDRRRITTNIKSVLWKITYQPGAIDQPDEERVVYVTELTAEVTSLAGANQTPASAIRNLLQSVGGLTTYVDQDNFDEYHALYDAAQYYFNGLIDGATRFHDALKSLIRQGTTRIAYNAGKIKLVSDFVESLEPVIPLADEIQQARITGQPTVRAEQTTQYIFKPDMRERSITEQRMRFDEITNKVTIRYDPDYKLEEWLGEYELTDEESIETVGEQEESLDYPYVSNADVISDIGARILELKGRPRAFDTFRVYAKAFPFEKQDQIFFETDFNDYFGVVGPIITANRVFGSGKDKRMNIFEITIMATPVVAHELDILDTIEIREDIDTPLVISADLNINETINISEAYTNEVQFTIELDITEQLQIHETVGRLQGVTKNLDISEVVQLSDAFSTESVLPITHLLRDTVEIYDQLRSEQNLEITLLIEEAIQMLETEKSFETLVGGYGVGGYGENGYGGSTDYWLVYFKTDYVTHGGDDVTFQK